MRLPVLLAFIGLSYVWGSTYLFIKIGLEYWPPFIYAGARNMVALLSLLPIMALLRRRVPHTWEQIWKTAVFGAFQGAAFALIFRGERYIPSGQTAVLIATMPIFVLVLGRIFLREAITWVKVAGIALGFGGMLLTATARGGAGFAGSGHEQLLGQVAVTVAALCYASSYIFAKRYMAFETFTQTSGHLFWSSLFLLAAGLVFDPAPTADALRWPAIGSLLYLGIIGSALAYWLMFYLLQHLGSLQASYVTLINPVVAVLMGVLLLGESWTALSLVGGVLVVAGAALVNRPERARAGASAQIAD